MMVRSHYTETETETDSATDVIGCCTHFICLGHSVSTPLMICIFTARKRSLGKGNAFYRRCLSTGAGGCLYDVTSCLAGGSLYVTSCLARGGSLSGGVCPGGRGSLSGRSPYTIKSGRYASYWNAFLSSVFLN